MAKADIQRALTMLDPATCAQVYELPNIMARESFNLQQDTVQDFDSLMVICIRYYQHHFRAVMATEPTVPEEFADGKVWEILDGSYQGGVEAAYRAAHQGLNGGLAGVLDAIRDYFLKDQENHYFTHTIMESVDVMDLDDIKTLMQQYLQRYGRHLDGDNLPSAEYLVMKYQDVIRNHAAIVRNVRMRFSW